jgi:predicted RecB family nuclease
MNNNIRKTEEGFEVDHTDMEQLRYAEQQSEPVPDALVNSIVSEESVKGDLLQEQIQKIRERNVPEVAKEIEREVAEKWAQEQLQDIDKEELRKGFSDMLLHNREVYHVTEGKITHIPWGTAEYDKCMKMVEEHKAAHPDDLMEKVPADEAIQHDMEMKPVQDVYTSLEEILDDLETIMSPYNKQESAIVLKLQRTIYAQKYIQDGKE